MSSLVQQIAQASSADAGPVTLAAWLLIALPLAGAAVLLLGGRRTDSFGPGLATGLSWGSFGLGVVIRCRR